MVWPPVLYWRGKPCPYQDSESRIESHESAANRMCWQFIERVDSRAFVFGAAVDCVVFVASGVAGGAGNGRESGVSRAATVAG